ncbi:MAG TPA: ABC transporter substrate-binding protein [Gaiellaceae bacterium]|nr:ABC transporter substrate-binding protein [Gaiellaceae bacterium]
MPADVRTGTVLAGFRVLSPLGEGAMGAVYLADEITTGRRVALKVLAPELARDERFRRRFLRETELAASLRHPHVVETFASGEADGALYLAMAYVDGSDLRELLQREGRLEAERAVRLVGQVAAALDAAHGAGLVHRDVKPGNILVASTDHGEHAYVCDFGLARHVSSVSSLTGERGFVGTIDYVPPEQIEGGTIDGRADLYSLGCVLYECLAGARPFDRESELSVVFAHLNEQPPRVSDLRPELPEAFDGVFATALAKSPDDRYATCGELAAAARAALRGNAFTRRKLRRRRVLVAAFAVLLAAVAAIGAVIASRPNHARGQSAAATIPLRPASLNLIDARTRRVVGRVSSAHAGFANGVTGITFSKNAAWVTTTNQAVVRVDLATRKVTAVRPMPWIPAGVATHGNAVWVLQDVGQEIIRLDARTGKIAQQFQVHGDPKGFNAGGAAYADGSLWLARGNGVVRVDPRTGRVLRRFPTASRWLVFADGAIWAAEPGSGRVWKIDPGSNRIVKAKLHGWLSGLAVGGGSVWAPVLPDGVVFKLGEDDLSVQASPGSGPDPESVSFGGGQLWIANTASNSLSSLDDVSGARREVVAEARPTLAVYHRGLVWTAAAAAPASLPPINGEELRVSTPTDTAVDPDPMGGKGEVRQLMYATCANLLYYPDSAGPQGTRLRPEIAAAMPTVSPDGRTYTFRIRRGYRFSPPSGEPVTAETFRHTLERSLSPKNVYSAGPQLASDIDGVAAYRAGKAAHITGIGAHGNVLAITLVRPAGDFLTRLSMFAFCPVPLSVPIYHRGFAEKPIPSAGPYYIRSIQGDRTVLERNPYYPGQRPRHAERITYTNDIPTAKAVVLADDGAVDLLPQDFDNTTPFFGPGGPLDRRKGPGSAAAQAGKQQYFPYDAPLVDAIAFNTARPLFTDVRLRRAVNDVLDRSALAAAYADAPASAIVPPAVPGFGSGHVYQVTRPDVASARSLAGGRKRHAVIAICGDPRLSKLAAIVRSDLARIGMTVSMIESQQCPGRYQSADLFFTTIGADGLELDPAPYVDQALDSSAYGSPLGPGPWRAAAFTGELRHARALRGQERLTAYHRIQAELTRMAPLAVFGSYVWGEYVSPAVKCRVQQAEFGFLDLGELCEPR